ncbi:uncharacterized protein LOC115780670 [Archocentrus centrarchus]|uniref:uncharacterized protein LOC115780670 n=1 Tax=Archocentrus centrarchus TaxID=63155 RepID=UPI0011E9D410|nr:uncharacterized protein LOC115780670 [Archocentrus centrarchus]
MGESALSSHMKGKKHQYLMRRLMNPGPTVGDFFQWTNNTSNSTATSTSTPNRVESDSAVEAASGVAAGVAPLPPTESTNPHQTTTRTTSTITSFVTSNSTLKAEICWAAKVVTSHYSYKSCENVGDVFRTMFSDSDIAKQFTGGERKVAYLTTFGIAPHFSSLMKANAKKESEYVLLFDESLNREIKKCQLDMHMRFWSDNQVNSRYLTSFFMGHHTAEHMYEKIEKVCSDIGFQNLIQLSMDGPNVNWKTFSLAQQNIEQQTGKKMLNIGSCGLHILHNAFRAGCASTDWDLGNALSSLKWLFKDVPARREDYTKVTGSTSFPLDFCNHRWLENIEVAERALQILPSLQMYISAAKTKTVTEPITKSFKTAQMILQDELFPAKLNFFLMVAREITPFLKLYQTDKPMLPFMCSDLTNTMRSLMEKFIKPSVMKNATTPIKLLQVDYADPVNHMDVTKLRVGFVTERALEEHMKKKSEAEKPRLEFRQNCKLFLLKMVAKLFEKAPLKYPLVRSLSVLDPRVLLESKDVSTRKLTTILRLLVEAGRIEEMCCDEILREFGHFHDNSMISASDSFRNFNPQSERLDEFYHGHLSNKPDFHHLWRVLKLVLVLSHGQASVERGFSVNKEVMVENLKEHSLIAQRIIIDHVNHIGGLLNIVYTKELLLSAAAARQKYHIYLDEQKRLKHDEQKAQKRKG